MGFGLSAAYFAIVCAITIGTIAISISIAHPKNARIRALGILGISLGYVVLSFFLLNIWSELMNRRCGQWPAFTLGILVGIPVLVITAGTILVTIGLSLYMMVLGRPPLWSKSIPAPSVSSRLIIGLGVVLILIILGVFVLGMIVKH